MPRSKSGVKRDPVNPEALQNAIKAVCASPEKKYQLGKHAEFLT